MSSLSGSGCPLVVGFPLRRGGGSRLTNLITLGWQALAQNCSELQLLNVGWCEIITDVGVTALAHGCPDLRVVDFCGCLLITGLSIYIALYCQDIDTDRI